MGMTQAEIDAIYIGKILAAHKQVDEYLAVYKTEPNDLRNLKLLFDSIFKCTSAHFEFLMALQCKPPQEYTDKLDKYMGMLSSISDRLSENRKKAEREIDGQIETLQARILELNKQRGRREIDAERYNTESREVMAKLDALFIERDGIAEQRSTVTLSKAFQEVVAEFLRSAGAQAEFDKDIFARLVDSVVVKSRDNIIFVLKDRSEVRADLREAA